MTNTKSCFTSPPPPHSSPPLTPSPCCGLPQMLGFAEWCDSPLSGNAPVKVNPDPAHLGTCGALVGLYHHIDSCLSPQYVGDSRVFLLLSWGMWGISRGFVLIQDGGVIPTRTSGNISAHGSGHKCLQVFVESVVLLGKSIDRLI